ncbi:MAG: hypothetical protein IKX54_02745 [Lachnospiraceae bacterium]|nr:hypothetical protein [Lachnospiraceae bacterium]
MEINLLNRPGWRQDEDIAPFKDDICDDLVLEPILGIMARNDNYIYRQCKSVLLSPLTDRENIRHRQSALRDAVRNKKTILSLYATVAEVVTDISNFRTAQRKKGNPLPAVRVLNAVEQLDLLANGMERLKTEIVNTYGHFTGMIFRDFYDDFLKEFSAEFVMLVHEKTTLLKTIEQNGELRISAQLGRGLKTEGYIVNSISEYQTRRKYDIMESLFSTRVKKNEIRISYDDVALNRDCRDLESAGLLHVASTFDSFSQELMKLFQTLRAQLAFYYGCCNLHSHMKNMVFPVCFPEISAEPHAITGEQFYDLGNAVKTQRIPTANDIAGDDTLRYLITGTNHGGKTTFIRSAAIAQLMAQCGMFVPAKSMITQVFNGFYTHFVRNEDETMQSGKLEEELKRLSKIIDVMSPQSIIFMNESFATTSERDGALIAEEILRAFFDNNVTCFFVTHIYAYVKKAYDEHVPRTQFLQAERTVEGERTYHMLHGEPSVTGYGMELYDSIINGNGEYKPIPEEEPVEEPTEPPVGQYDVAEDEG